MFKIDLHTHMLPPTVPDFSKKFGYGDWVNLTPIPEDEPGQEPNPFAGGARMSINGNFFRDVKPNCLHADARLLNDDLAERCRVQPVGQPASKATRYAP